MSNPFPPGFLELLDASPGPVLDCGSAGRRWPGIISLDIIDTTVHVRADALNLPFPADTFDLVLSQAVLEHVTDPQRYIDEITRVLQPGGILFCEVAWQQPLHQQPHHYYNVSPYGLAHLCRHLDTVDAGVFGLMTESWDWIGGEMGAREALTVDEFAMVRTLMARVDERITPAQLAAVAPGVRRIARKR